MSSEKSIGDWRDGIDAIDKDIVRLLGERGRCVLEIGRIKGQRNVAVFDPLREQQVFRNALSHNTGPLDDAAVHRIFQCIVEEFRRIEESHGG
jgi:chorismate mutase-like protein